MGGAMLIDCSVSLLIIRFLAVRLGYGRRLMHALHAARAIPWTRYVFVFSWSWIPEVYDLF